MLHPFEQTLSKMAEFGLFNDYEERQKDEFLLDIERKIKPETDYFKFLSEFNRITGKRYDGDIESRKLFYKHQATYSRDELIQAITNANKNPFFKSATHILTPSFILFPDNLGQYLNYSPPANANDNGNGKPKTKIKNGDYTEIQNF